MMISEILGSSPSYCCSPWKPLVSGINWPTRSVISKKELKAFEDEEELLDELFDNYDEEDLQELLEDMQEPDDEDDDEDEDED